MKECKPGEPCTILSEEMTFDMKERKSVFCFSVYTESTRRTKLSFELDLLKMVYRRRRALLPVRKLQSMAMFQLTWEVSW